ncbi:tRNA (adenosine(37)-N6)-threonylcarbamoyltransferase complex ATPase subunit type 1 TsaE [Adhaeribacter radiodurans]|uniref:tRNA threonylcarbamoyladenosine biosynthesis protein TsaE n=1 Tax=Adhaeribacter radiodurans TaxID=2745197 RepID=A0A7L7LBE3_9BACT|nr:tRNA (adenosine(37)-N6)-threonylcarbamoyltransferase complex ATPase subunit type 1 TsaE [Adhaeribacter radiodurans]QMU30024.1 tRNA (adenosine(37)-N6)-threonylcarbamoyltransferase complex ATPase subunit type 1 TsaE [Adhaeribacter radiodurans]
MLSTEPDEYVLNVASKEDLPWAVAELIRFAADQKIWLFEGDMAAGKTTFIKAICAAKGVTDAVSSPTYSLVNEYETAEQERLYHFDFYRINNEEEALDMGVLDYFDSGNLCLIEWPSKIKSLLPTTYLLVNLEVGAGEARIITLKQ